MEWFTQKTTVDLTGLSPEEQQAKFDKISKQNTVKAYANFAINGALMIGRVAAVTYVVVNVVEYIKNKD